MKVGEVIAARRSESDSNSLYARSVGSENDMAVLCQMATPARNEDRYRRQRAPRLVCGPYEALLGTGYAQSESGTSSRLSIDCSPPAQQDRDQTGRIASILDHDNNFGFSLGRRY